jgi:hypothetical protein
MDIYTYIQTKTRLNPNPMPKAVDGSFAKLTNWVMPKAVDIYVFVHIILISNGLILKS